MCVSANSFRVDSLLRVLENEISHSDRYIARRQARIDSLCAIRPMTEELQLRIAEEYQHFQSDSSRAWFLKLVNAKEPIRSKALIQVIDLLRTSGHFNEGITLFSADKRPPLRDSESYKVVWLLFEEAAAYTPLPSFKTEWAKTAKVYYDSMMVAYQREAEFSQEALLWYDLYRASEQQEWKLAKVYSEQILARWSPLEHRYAIYAYGHAMICGDAGDAEERREWLIRSAITDVRCGITDNGSSWIVAQECFDQGNVRQAFRISDYSVNNATFFNAPGRLITNFGPGHLISNKYEYEQRKYSILLTIMLILFAGALAALWGFFYHNLQKNRQLKALNEQLSVVNKQLQESNNVKEQYICRYLEVYSDYIRRLTTMARKAGEKDPTGFMDREMENFYRSFDDTFLSIYGSFVQEFNALLKPEARITPKPGERMTVEMRIFALILLGITSSAKIAELLCYSPNTISNYRVKMKNSCLGNRDTFEERVQRIRTFSDIK